MVALLIALIAANHSQRLIDVVYAKGSSDGYLFDEFARWNAISRVEVLSWDGPDKWASIDAVAATLIVNADPQDPKSISYVKSGPHLPVSPTCFALRANMQSSVRAAVSMFWEQWSVEVRTSLESKSIPSLPIPSFAGAMPTTPTNLYQLPQVHIHVSEGRSWIRGSQEKYDVIQMTLVDTWASTSAGAFALSENNLYTVEAFGEYFDHLNSDGFLAITRWEFSQPREALRVVSEAIEMLRRSRN